MVVVVVVVVVVEWLLVLALLVPPPLRDRHPKKDIRWYKISSVKHGRSE